MKPPLRIAYVMEYLLPHFVEKDTLPVPIELARQLGALLTHYARPISPPFDDVGYPFQVTWTGTRQNAGNRVLLAEKRETECTFSIWFYLRAAFLAAGTNSVAITVHLNSRTVAALLFFKLCRWIRGHHALTYLKSDTDAASVRMLVARGSPGARISDRLKAFFLNSMMLYAIDFLSVESADALEAVCQGFPAMANRTLILRNCPPDSLWRGAGPLPPASRKRQILSVARFGTNQKATDVLLAGFSRFHIRHPEWTLVLAGPSAPGFEAMLDPYRNLVERGAIRCLGPVADKEQLRALYIESALFALPSRFEGSSVALVEACCLGCVPICTPVGSARETLGELFPRLTVPVDNPERLEAKLDEVASDPALQAAAAKYLLARGEDLHWERQVFPLTKLIQARLRS